MSRCEESFVATRRRSASEVNVPAGEEEELDIKRFIDDNRLNEPVRPADVGPRSRSTSQLFYPSLVARRRLCPAILVTAAAQLEWQGLAVSPEAD